MGVTLYFTGADRDVEKDAGPMMATMMVLLTSDSGARLPMVYNGVTLTTERLDTNGWTVSTGESAFTVELDSDTRATLTAGTLKPQTGGFEVALSEITLTKQPASGPSLNVDSVMSGAWTARTGSSGGFVDFDNNGMHNYFLASSSPYAVGAGFSFKDIDTGQGTTTIKGGLALRVCLVPSEDQSNKS